MGGESAERGALSEGFTRLLHIGHRYLGQVKNTRDVHPTSPFRMGFDLSRIVPCALEPDLAKCSTSLHPVEDVLHVFADPPAQTDQDCRTVCPSIRLLQPLSVHRHVRNDPARSRGIAELSLKRRLGPSPPPSRAPGSWTYSCSDIGNLSVVLEGKDL